LLYIDPPYYQKGNDLYHVGFSIEDHIRLADVLRKTKHRWILSYDECDEVQGLYGWATIERVSVNYSITAKISNEQRRESRWKYEYVIRPSAVSA
jgi:DNA adenine methylase